MCALRHQLCDDSVIHQMRLTRPKQKYALAPGALSWETNYAAYASAAASGHYRLPTMGWGEAVGIQFPEKSVMQHLKMKLNAPSGGLHSAFWCCGKIYFMFIDCYDSF